MNIFFYQNTLKAENAMRDTYVNSNPKSYNIFKVAMPNIQIIATKNIPV
jgi:hypothetical protein